MMGWYASRSAGRRWIARVGLLGALVLAQRAEALTVGGAGGPELEVDPIYFAAFGEFGLIPNAPPDYIAVAPVTFLSIAPGSGLGIDLLLEQELKKPVIQHPQDPTNSQNPGTNGGVPSDPTTALPFVADSQWTVRNTSGSFLDDLVLLFTRVIDDPGYPAVDVALDGGVYDVLAYTNASDVTRFYGAIALGDLAPDTSVQFDVRYIVAGPLPIIDGEYAIPRFGLAGLAHPARVPEPGTALLVALGLVACVGRSRA